MKLLRAFALLLVLANMSAVLAGERPRELIVLLLMDATRADHVSAYGYSRVTTPNLNRLSQSGRRFTRAYTNAPWTRPATTSFLTGMNASRHRTETENSKLPKDIVTLAERLHRGGWATAGFSANGHGGSLAGLNRGFDVFRDPTNTYTRSRRRETYNGLPPAPFIAKEVLGYLAGANADKQFLFVFFVDPHDPYQAPPALEKMFLGDFTGTIRRHASWEYNNHYRDDERYSMMAVYDAAIFYADQAFGELIAGLKAQGLYDQATIFVSADHGEGFGEHDFYLHAHHFWEEVIHIPLIVKGPRFAVGADDRLTQPIDVTATILDCAGLAQNDLAGHSLLGPAAAAPRVISEYNEFGIHRQAIMDGRYKVIWQRPADEAWFLRTAQKKDFFPSVSFDHEVVQVFDLRSDPAEKVDLSADMPEAAQVLLTELRAYVAQAPVVAVH